MKYLQVSSMREEQALLGNAILISVTTADIWQIASTRQKQTTNQQYLFLQIQDKFQLKNILYNTTENSYLKRSQLLLCAFLSQFWSCSLPLCPFKNNFFLIIKTKRFVYGQKLIHSNLMHSVKLLVVYRILRLKSECHKNTSWPQKNPFHIVLFIFQN